MPTQLRYHRVPEALSLFAFSLLHFGCGAEGDRSQVIQRDEQTEAAVTREEFGRLTDGTPVDVFTLTNAAGMVVRAITYGGIITSLRVPDRDGQVDDVVLGFDDLAGYLVEHPYFGRGEVVHVSGSGPSTRLKVHFINAGEKLLMLEHARLKKIL